MRMHVITHVPFEGPGRIAEWARERGHTITTTLAMLEEFEIDDRIDLLVVMGGPMGATDETQHPWLVSEKRYIAAAIEAGLPVLGVCLGAQIIADVLGGTVRRNPEPEIGFYPVHRAMASAGDPVFRDFPRELVVGHWHGDTFDLPGGFEPAVTSEACANQAFSVKGARVVGLQFHLEWSPADLKVLALECADELVAGGRWVTTAPDMLAEADTYLPVCREVLFDLLDRWSTRGDPA